MEIDEDEIAMDSDVDDADCSDRVSDDDEMVASVLALSAASYADAYFFKEPCRTSSLTGASWVKELEEGNPTRIFENFRMSKAAFAGFCTEIELVSPTTPWSRLETRERVAIFLYCVSRHASNRELQERFQRSGETIHRNFHQILDAVCSLATKYIVMPTTGSADLSTESKYASQFDNCRLAFDGTHIPAFVEMENAKPFRDRNGKLSQNVFAACTFDMMFAYVLAGWEGSAADSTVLADARRRGFRTPANLFDLGDAGYALSKSVMTPYRGVRYHLREWGQAQQRPQNYKELYNLRHAQARNVIERAFGVLKRRFRVLQQPPEFGMKTQAKLVVACCVLHNFIRLQRDPDDDPGAELEVDLDEHAEDEMEPENGVRASRSEAARYDEAKAFRDNIAKAMWQSYASIRRARADAESSQIN